MSNFVCGVPGCPFQAYRPALMMEHILDFDHRTLPAHGQPHLLPCGVAACALTFASESALRLHRATEHAVPRRPSGYGESRLFGRCPTAVPRSSHSFAAKSMCLASHCRGAVFHELNASLVAVGRARRLVLGAVQRVRSSSTVVAAGTLAETDPMQAFAFEDAVRSPEFRQGSVELQLMAALGEHDWPRVRTPDGEPVRCSACLGSYDAHCMLRCGQLCRAIDDADGANDAARFATERLCGPNEPYARRDALVYCGLSYHTYCMRPRATLIDAELVQEAYRRLADFLASFNLTRWNRNKLPSRLQVEGNIWRCRECALAGRMPRPYFTRDTRRLRVPIIDALHAVVSSGHGSPYAHRLFSLFLFHMTSLPHTMLRSLDAISELKRADELEDEADVEAMASD